MAHVNCCQKRKNKRNQKNYMKSVIQLGSYNLKIGSMIIVRELVLVTLYTLDKILTQRKSWQFGFTKGKLALWLPDLHPSVFMVNHVTMSPDFN